MCHPRSSEHCSCPSAAGADPEGFNPTPRAQRSETKVSYSAGFARRKGNAPIPSVPSLGFTSGVVSEGTAQLSLVVHGRHRVTHPEQSCWAPPEGRDATNSAQAECKQRAASQSVLVRALALCHGATDTRKKLPTTLSARGAAPGAPRWLPGEIRRGAVVPQHRFSLPATRRASRQAPGSPGTRTTQGRTPSTHPCASHVVFFPHLGLNTDI